MKIRLLIVLTVVFTGLGFAGNFQVWQKSGQGIYESDIQKLFVNPADDTHVYAGTSRALYKSIDKGRHYQMILRLSGEPRGVNDMDFSSSFPQAVYVATDAGLFESLDEGKTWERIYHSSDAALRKCFSVKRYGNFIYVGTSKGLFSKEHQQTQWDQIKEGLEDEPVYQISEKDEFLYFATGESVFRFQTQTRRMEKIFSLGISRELEINDALDETFENENVPSIRCLAALNVQSSYIFIASTKGIYSSYDNGENWGLLPSGGLALEGLTSFVAIKTESINREDCGPMGRGCFKFLAGTQKGAFFLNDGKWMPVYKGMETNEINGLAKNAHETVYAATNKGIFYLSLKEEPPSLIEEKKEWSAPVLSLETAPENLPRFDHEPGIHEVHQMAIDYAEVSHEKILGWRRQARQRAWFPDLDVGVDSGRGWSSSDSIWGSYTSGGQHYVGPDDKTRREDIGWDVSLSWDLGDLVWSTYQTTIDSRSKLMVELREDILNEVTRIYFERRRNQIDLALDHLTDWKVKIEKEMRVAELTALIDALTGGEFSRRMVDGKAEDG